MRAYVPAWFRSNKELKRRRVLSAKTELFLARPVALSVLVNSYPCRRWEPEGLVRIPALLLVDVPPHAGRWTSADGSVITLKRHKLEVVGCDRPTAQDLIITVTELQLTYREIPDFSALIAGKRFRAEYFSGGDVRYEVTDIRRDHARDEDDFGTEAP
jgi:hypothetical protein